MAEPYGRKVYSSGGRPAVFTALYRDAQGISRAKILQANSRAQLLQRVRKLKPYFIYNETFRQRVEPEWADVWSAPHDRVV